MTVKPDVERMLREYLEEEAGPRGTRAELREFRNDCERRFDALDEKLNAHVLRDETSFATIRGKLESLTEVQRDEADKRRFWRRWWLGIVGAVVTAGALGVLAKAFGG